MTLSATPTPVSSQSPLPVLTQELARLVWLLVHRPESVDEQKAALRAALGATRTTSHSISHTELSQCVAEWARAETHPIGLALISELVSRMASHSVRVVEILPKAKAAEILGLARALASDGVRGDSGAAFDDRILALAPETITVHLGRNGFVRHATPPVAQRALGAPPAQTPPSSSRAQPVEVAGATDDASESPEKVDQSILRSAFSRSFMNEPLDDLLLRLRGDLGSNAQQVLDEVSRYAEEMARRGKWSAVVDVVGRLMEREGTAGDDVKALFAVQYRRLSTPMILKGLAALLPQAREVRGTVHAFLARVGDAGGDVLVELLATAESPKERRAYRDAILSVPSAAQPLIHQLRHPQWYVVRNAAELIGEMNLQQADTALMEVLEHEDSRVRRTATLALIRLSTPKALLTIVRALQDSEADVRLNAARGLGTMESSRIVPALLAALDEEKVEEVQQALLWALGRQRSKESVERLIREAQPAGLLKRKRPLPRRLAATAALGEAGTHEAMTVLRGLQRDKEREVRELADKLVREKEAGVAATQA